MKTIYKLHSFNDKLPSGNEVNIVIGLTSPSNKALLKALGNSEILNDYG